MPVTPFHGGIGLLAKGVLGRRFSFIVFCATQGAIDCESAYHLLRGDWPVHRFFHTLLGATIISAAAALVCRIVAIRWPGSSPADLRIARSIPVLLTTVAAGVLGHVIPDGIMHSDVVPLAPFSAENPLFDLIGLGTLHAALVLAGVAGLILLILRRKWRRQVGN